MDDKSTPQTTAGAPPPGSHPARAAHAAPAPRKLTRKDIVRALVLGVRSYMPANSSPPIESYIGMRKAAEDVAESIEDMNPVGVDLVIAMCVRHGQIPAAGEIAVIVDETHKILKALERPMDEVTGDNPDREKMDPEERRQLVGTAMVRVRAAMD